MNKFFRVFGEDVEDGRIDDTKELLKVSEDDYEFLENMDFLSHIDLVKQGATQETDNEAVSDALPSDERQTNEATEEQKEISIELDFLDKLTSFDELGYFDELNKSLEKEVSDIEKELDSNTFIGDRSWRRYGWVFGIGVIVLIGACIYFNFQPKEQYTFNDTLDSKQQYTVVTQVATTSPIPTPTQTPLVNHPSNQELPKPLPSTVPSPTNLPTQGDNISTNGDTTPIDMECFNDTVFVGNSLTVALQQNSKLTNTTFLAAKSLNILNAFYEKIYREKGTKTTLTILEALSLRSYDKVYIMFGINEMGWPSVELFGDKYAEFIDQIKQLQPHAKIYIQSILPVTKHKSEDNEMFSLQNISKFNEQLKKVASENSVEYLDIASAVQDREGYLPADASGDGVHLKKTYLEKWLAYIQEHS